MNVFLKSQLLKRCPYRLINLSRKVRGNIRLTQGALVKFGIQPNAANVSEAIKRGFISVATYSAWAPAGRIEHLTASELGWAPAFEFYRADTNQKKSIDLLWTDGPKPGNFGDWLSPYVIHKLTSRSIRLVDDYRLGGTKHLVAVGSLAPAVTKNSQVIGAGAARQDSKMNTSAKYYSVRGPHTASILRQQGGPNVDAFGDLGFLLKKLYTPQKISLAADTLLVRHLNHKHLPIKLPAGMMELSIEAASPIDIENFVDTLYSAKKVVTTAMHCYIACQSYGIPCALVTFKGVEDAVYGDGIKYLDAMGGVGLPERYPLRISPNDLHACDSLIFDSFVKSEVLDEIERYARQSLTSYFQDE